MGGVVYCRILSYIVVVYYGVGVVWNERWGGRSERRSGKKEGVCKERKKGGGRGKRKEWIKGKIRYI